MQFTTNKLSKKKTEEDSSPDSNIDEIQIINQLGQAVMKYENLRSTTQINLDKLKSGIYFVKFRAESNTEIHQIIKK